MKSRFSIALALGVFFLLSKSAHADEDHPRIVVRVHGDANAALQERPAGGRDDEWSFVCEVPCEATITPDPFSEHRIVAAHAKITPLELRGSDGERVDVDLKHGAADTRRALYIGGAIVGGTGLVLAGVALPYLLAPAPSAHECGQACAAQREDMDNAARIFSIGIATMAASGAMFILGAVLGRSTLSITHGRELAPRGLPTNRQPEWTGPEPPKPPPMHARFLTLRF